MANRDKSGSFVAVRSMSTDETEFQGISPAPPSSFIGIAIFSTFFNVIFGVVAICFSVSSRSASKEGNFKLARQKARISLALSILGLVVTALLVAFLAVYFLVIVEQEPALQGTPTRSLLESMWKHKIPELVRPYWCEWYGYNSWYCKGPL